MTRFSWLTLMLASATTFAAAGCSRPSGGDPTGGRAPDVSSAPSAGAQVRSPGAPAATSITWTGTYTSTPGSLYVRDGGEWQGVHFRGDDAAVGLGEGTLSVTVDRSRGRANGSGSGPIGDVVFTGAITGDVVGFSVLRKEPGDRGLTGTGVGRVTGDSLVGTMHLSYGDARVIREAAFRLSKATP